MIYSCKLWNKFSLPKVFIIQILLIFQLFIFSDQMSKMIIDKEWLYQIISKWFQKHQDQNFIQSKTSFPFLYIWSKYLIDMSSSWASSILTPPMVYNAMHPLVERGDTKVWRMRNFFWISLFGAFPILSQYLLKSSENKINPFQIFGFLNWCYWCEI